MTLLLTLPRAEVAIRLRCCAPDLTAPNLPCGGDGVPDLCCIKETCPFAECHMDRIIVRRVESPLWAKVLFSWHGSTLLLWVAIAAFATVLALAVWAWTRPIAAAAPSTINHRLLTADGEPSTADGPPFIVTVSLPFVASSIKPIYHRAGCRYAKLMEHRVEYETHEEAQADGKVPCKVCLPIIEVARGE